MWKTWEILKLRTGIVSSAVLYTTRVKYSAKPAQYSDHIQ